MSCSLSVAPPSPSPPTPLSLDALATNVQRGQPRALSRLLGRLRAEIPLMLRGEIAKRGYRLCPADVDEVVQTVLIGVWTTDLLRFDPKRGSFGGFVRRRVRWTLLDYVRSLSRRATRPLFDDQGTRGDDPLSLLEAADREQVLLALPRLVDEALEDESKRDPLAAASIRAKDIKGELLRPLASAVGRHPAALTRARQRGLLRLRERLIPQLSRSAFAAWRS